MSGMGSLPEPQAVAAVALVVASYTLGCANAAYYLGRWATGRDIRDTGSGNAGATNAGRLLGRAGFAAVFAFDLAKGAVAVAASRHLGAPPALVVAAAWAVMAGHIWPVQMRFRGGKGIATLLGALLVACPASLVGPAILFVPLFAVFRRPVFAGLLSLPAAPAAAAWFGTAPWDPLAAGLLVATAGWAHRRDFGRHWRGRPPTPSPRPESLPEP